MKKIYKISEKTRKKMSESHKDKHHSEETRKKMSENHADMSGKNNPMYGKHFKHTEKWKKEHSKRISGKKHPLYGKHHSKKSKEKISDSKKRYYKEHPEAILKGENNSMYGRHQTEKQKKRMTEVHKGKIPWNKGKKMKDDPRIAKSIKAMQKVNKNLKPNFSVMFSSKNEREIRDYFIKKFEADNWNYKECLFFKGRRLVPDLISKKLKVIFEYDGIWHFEKVYDGYDLKNKQERDKILEEWCLINEFRLVRLDADLYKKNKDFWLQKLINEFYNGKEQIVKFGNRYESRRN